jgi:hypothetical protein
MLNAELLAGLAEPCVLFIVACADLRSGCLFCKTRLYDLQL